MTTRSYVALLSSLIVIAASTTVLAEPAPAPYPQPAPGYPQPGVAPPLILGPASGIPYHNGWPVPPSYHLESRTRKAMVWTGAAMFGGLYLLSLGALTNPGGEWMLIPIAGPVLWARHQECASPCDDIGTPILTVFLAGGETVGAALLASGFLFKRQWLVPGEAHAASARRPTITFLPRIDRMGASLAAIGAF